MTSRIRQVGLLIIVLPLFVHGCASNKASLNSPESYTSRTTWIRAAQLDEKKGDLQQALFKYRIARTLSRGGADIRKEINRLKNSILEKTENLSFKADKARRERKYNQAQQIYLEILSLDPKHQLALKGLRELDEQSSKRRMKKKVAQSRRHRNRKSDVNESQPYQDEEYAYSRQTIMESGSRADNVAAFIGELETHVIKYPKDIELREKLLNIRIVEARKLFQAMRYGESLQQLQQIETVFKNDKQAISRILEMRKEFAKSLYLKGVRGVRSEQGYAVNLWKAALKFDPDDKRIRLRIQNVDAR